MLINRPRTARARTRGAWRLGVLLWGFGLALVWSAPARAQSAEAAETAATSPAQIQSQLMEGVRAFRAEQYESALAIFRRIESTTARPDIGFYLGMVLHKLGQHGEALVAFRTARRAGLSESIADYYRAVSCFRLGQFERARAGFRALLQPSAEAEVAPLGPRLVQGAERFVAAIEHAVPASPDRARPETDPSRRFEAALQKADALLPRSDAEAQEWLEEAALILPALSAREHAAALSRFHSVLLRIQQVASGPATAVRNSELGTLWQSVRTGPHR